MSDTSYTQYNNVQVFAKEWRGYIAKSEPLARSTFDKELSLNKHVKLEYMNPKNGRSVVILLFMPDNQQYAMSSTALKRILNRIKNPCDVIIITQKPLGSYSKSAVREFAHLRIYSYLHENFNIILPNGPLCYKHRILSKDEVDNLLNNELYCYLINLPKIVYDDPQCIWLGCEIGDVIEITSPSDISGEFITYRVVVPKQGVVMNIKNFSSDKKTDIAESEINKSRRNSLDIDADIEEPNEHDMDHDHAEDNIDEVEHEPELIDDNTTEEEDNDE